MKVVLVTKIKNLGEIGDVVDVKSGFARNFLLPYHKALPATDKYIEQFEKDKEKHLKQFFNKSKAFDNWLIKWNDRLSRENKSKKHLLY